MKRIVTIPTAEADTSVRHKRVKAASDCQQFTPTTDNRAEGEQGRQWELSKPLTNQILADDLRRGNLAASIYCIDIPESERQTHFGAVVVFDDPERAAFIVRACNEHYERGERIEQLKQIIRDQMSVLRDWRGADNVPQQVRDVMAIRLTELRQVVEGK